MSVAVIPARGGSKRLPRKNIREFCGRPMIAWPIAAALESGLFNRVIVSTDDAEIADVARAHGAEIPFRRPDGLADDHATVLDVMQHAAHELKGEERLCCIYATAPFIRAEDLAAADAMMTAGNWRYVLPVASFAFPVQRALVRNEDGSAAMLYPEHERTRSQDLPECYHDAGQFILGRREAFAANEAVFASHTGLLVLPRKRVQDIDTAEDWEMAEAMFRVQNAAVAGS